MFTVFGFYKFQKINDLKKNQKILSNLLNNRNINGSIIISKEGLNLLIELLKLSNSLIFKIFFNLIIVVLISLFIPEIDPFKPSLEMIIDPFIFLLVKRLLNIF